MFRLASSPDQNRMAGARLPREFLKIGYRAPGRPIPLKTGSELRARAVANREWVAKSPHTAIMREGPKI